MADLNKELMQACKSGDLELVNSLIDKGADISTSDNRYRTPLYWASKNGHDKIVELLISKFVNAKDNIEHSGPLHMASVNGNLKIVEMLISSGALVNDKNYGEVSPLHMASENGNLEVAEFLIEKGADVNAENRDGATPLNYAISRGQLEIVKLLLSKGANIKRLDRDTAKSHGYKEIVEILDSWPSSMAFLALEENKVDHNLNMDDYTNLTDYMGKKDIDYGGKRRNKKSNKKIKKYRKSKKQKSIKRRK
jgi:ankyrin repeat protein